jgi:hypothetical protein
LSGAFAENQVSDVCNPRKRSHLGTANPEERQNKAPHFLCHHDMKKCKECILCSNKKVEGARKATYF